MQKRQSVSQKFTYWLKVVSLGLILGLGLQFAQAWVAPTVAPPGGNVGGPVTTGGNQTKTGSLTTSGLSAPSLVDSDNASRYVNPSGTSALWSLTLASLPTCDLKTDASGAVYCGTDAGGSSYVAGTGLTLSGSTFSINNTQTQTRVTGTCAAGSSIRVINQDGTVSCETDDLGAAGGVSGGGTANYLPRWSAATNLVDSVLYQHGTNAVVGGTDSLGYKFGVYGTIGATGNITTAGKVYSAATIATDGASTLTTKGYVDGKVATGVPGSIVAGCAAPFNFGGGGCKAESSCWGGATPAGAYHNTLDENKGTCPSGSTLRRTGSYLIYQCGGDSESWTTTAFICIK